MSATEARLDQRQEIARYLLSMGMQPQDYELAPEQGGPGLLAEGVAAAAKHPQLEIDFPAALAPKTQRITPAPAPDAPLPQADIVVVTWTVDEVDGLCNVLTPGATRDEWYRYSRGFEERYAEKIRRGAPSLLAKRMASYMPTRIGKHDVLCMKSELHLNQDGISNPAKPGTATLPVKDLFQQIVEETKAKAIFTIGTAGSVFEDFGLGDVVVTRGAKFRLQKEFRNEPFANTAYKSDWEVPTKQLAKAEKLMEAFADKLTEPPVGAPTGRYTPKDELLTTPPNKSAIRLDGRDMPDFHPVLTTDYFEYGTTTNHLDKEGATVEMGDAVLGLLCEELPDPPKWLVVRNMSDPCINGHLPTKPMNEQTMWAIGYYTTYGYWTSVNGALATWAVIAGLEPDALG